MTTKEQKEKIELENKKIVDNISHVKHNIVVFSGKGGVGKTIVSFKNINGQILDFNGLKVFPLTHPSALLYNPSFETITIEKYKKLKDFL